MRYWKWIFVAIGLVMVGAIGVFITPILQSRFHLFILMLFVLSFAFIFVKKYRVSLLLFAVGVELNICFCIITQDVRITLLIYILAYGYLYLKLNKNAQASLRDLISNMIQAGGLSLSRLLLVIYYVVIGGNGIYYSLMGGYYNSRHRPERAIGAYRKSQSRSVNNAYLDYNIGICLYESSQYEEALLVFKKCLQSKICYENSINNAIASSYILGRFDECRGYCKMAVKTNKDKNIAYYFNGLLLEVDGNSDMAKHEYAHIDDTSSYATKRDIRIAVLDYEHRDKNKILVLLDKYSDSSKVFREAKEYFNNASSELPWLIKPIGTWTLLDRVNWASL
jgi:tetratricopeptide (TPR) repeat protein